MNVRGNGWLARLTPVLAAFMFAAPSAASTPRRIVSLNACSDQLLLALADRPQIAALTHFAAEPEYSIYAAEVQRSGIPLIAGNAEQVLKFKPDLVLAGTYSRAATRAFLDKQNVTTELFEPPTTVEEAEREITRTAELVGHPERGAALIADIQHAFGGARAIAAKNLSVLQLQRRAYTSGRATLFGDLLARLGVRNAAQDLGISSYGQTTMEIILKAAPDALIMSDPAPRASDQGTALLLHPALTSVIPASRRIALAHNLIECGGPTLPLAISALTEGLRRIEPRRTTAGP
jgi:iron complex transport system substrate-binding protein